MKTAENFFSKDEQERIETAVRAAEAQTSGEIVPMVVDESYDYPRAELIGAGTSALGLGLLFSGLFGHSSIWWFLPAYIVCFVVLQQLIRRLPNLKRRLISPREFTLEVREKALISFVEQGLHETRDKTGILILISLFERRVQVLADSGINAKVPEQTWDDVVERIVRGLKSDNPCNAVCNAVSHCGQLLAQHFPRREDDENELPNLILKS